MLKEIKNKTTFFYDVPAQISYVGYSLKRGFYTRMETVNGIVIWLNNDDLKTSVQDYQMEELEKMYKTIA